MDWRGPPRAPSNASLRPGGWAEGGSPYGSTYSGVSSYASSPAGSPMPYSPCSPATVPPPLSGRTPSGGYPGTPSGLGLSPGLFGPGPQGGASGGGLRTPATAATLGSPAPGLGLGLPLGNWRESVLDNDQRARLGVARKIARAVTLPVPIVQLLERNRDEFKEYRDKNRKFIDCLNPVVQFVHAISGILGEATSLIPFQPASWSSSAINVLFTITLSSSMTEIIVKIMIELLSILSQAKKQIKQGRFKKFAKKLLGDSEIESILRRLDRLTQDEARMTDAHILEWFMDGGEASTSEIRRLSTRRKNQVIARRDVRDGSAVWFTRGNIFKEWNAKGCLLWILGNLSTIIEENTTKQDVRGLLSSLLVQLCAKSDSCYHILSYLFFSYDNGSRLPDDKALVQCLKDMLQLPKQPAIYLVIDALDECPNTSGVVSPRERVLELIKNLVNLPVSNLRVCVTSRPEADILDALAPLASHTVSLHDEDGQKQEMIEYVTSVVQSRKWSAEDKKLVVDTISERADGMFQWVICQLEALRRRIPGTIARALKELPRTLDETYERILLGIDEDNHEYAHCLFQCLCASVRPLRLAELAEVLAVLLDTGRDSEDHIDWRSEDAQNALISACSSLITVINVDGFPVVQFTHFTVREFLTSDRLANADKRLSRYHILLHSAHNALARLSLNVLFSLDGQVNKSAVEKHPLAIYAARHWIDHAKFEGESPNIQDFMKRLFDQNAPHFAAWIWMYDFDHPWEKQMATTRPNQPEASPLYYASLCGLPCIVEHLAATRPGDVNARGGHYVTPLYASLANREFDTSRALLRHGADINAPGMNGFSPLHSASLGGDREAVQLLLEHQADINVKKYTKEGVYTLAFTPLYFSALAGQLEVCRGYLDIVEMLLEMGADIDARDKLGSSPFDLAPSFWQWEITWPLAKRFGPPEPVNPWHGNRKTSLHVASKEGRLDVVRLLIGRGEDVNCRDEQGHTPLALSSQSEHLEVVRLLLDHGADLDTTCQNRLTALHNASSQGYFEIVQLLIERGANVNAVGHNGFTPLQGARLNKKNKVIQLLVEHGAT
ncbi:hypothetical protein EDB86DRAFT_3249747 [Lactarius hatsudake]|nr:hypothetical protein EDB86DRAFT_3249747 [Lactarius hatsudake]